MFWTSSGRLVYSNVAMLFAGHVFRRTVNTGKSSDPTGPGEIDMATIISKSIEVLKAF